MFKHLISFLGHFPSRKVGKVVVSLTVFVLFVFILVMLIEGVNPVNKKTKQVSEFDKILITKAKEIYQKQKDLGMDMTDGPCLSNDLDLAWVLDIAHDPRQPIDDLLVNQCPAFIDGTANHFIELDPAGNLIRLQ